MDLFVPLRDSVFVSQPIQLPVAMSRRKKKPTGAAASPNPSGGGGGGGGTTLTAGRASPSRGWVAVGLALLLTLGAMARVVGSDFTSWDDHETIARNPNLNPPTLDGLGRLWTTQHMHLYVPVTYTAWWVTAAVAGTDPHPRTGIALDPQPFHALNLLIHLAATLAVYWLLRQLKFAPWPAAVGAALFGVHPVQVESVAWTSGTKDLLCGLFATLALALYVRAAQRATDDQAGDLPRGAAARDYALATGTLLLGMLSKPTTMVVPAAALVIDLLLLHRPLRRAPIWLAPWAVLSAICAIVARAVQPPAEVASAGPLVYRPLVALDSIAFYVGKLLLPVGLTVDYGRSPEAILASGSLFVSWVVPFALAALAGWLIWKRRQPMPAVAMAVALIGVGPILGLVSFDFQAMSNVADHYLYLPMVGVAMLAAWVMSQLARPIWLGAAGAVLVALAIRSSVQAGTWRDTGALFAQVLRVNPDSSAAHNSLAVLATQEGRPADAIQLGERAVALEPRSTVAWVSLGAAYAMTGDLDRAVERYRTAHAIAPDDPKALAALGGITAMTGDLEAALPLLRRAVDLDPGNAQAQLNLGTLLLQRGQFTGAVAHLRAAVTADRSNPQAWTNLGVALAQAGQREQAAQCFRAALSIDPRFAPAANELRALSAGTPAGNP
jgi:Flp pilus assembly protein TadD